MVVLRLFEKLLLVHHASRKLQAGRATTIAELLHHGHRKKIPENDVRSLLPAVIHPYMQVIPLSRFFLSLFVLVRECTSTRPPALLQLHQLLYHGRMQRRRMVACGGPYANRVRSYNGVSAYFLLDIYGMGTGSLIYGASLSWHLFFSSLA